MDSLSGVLGRTEQLSGELTQDNQSLTGALAVTRTIEVPTSYEDLSNKPKINNVELVGNKTGTQLGLASSSDIPTELKDLSDDSTHRLVTDTEKSTWNGKADTDDIPTKLSDLDDDATHRLVTDTEKSTWNAKANVSDIPDISGKADKSTTLAGYGITNAYTKTETDGLISPITTKLSDLDEKSLSLGTLVRDAYIDKDTGNQISQSGWDSSDYIDLSGATHIEVTSLYQATPWNSFYDSSKNYISNADIKIGTNKVTIPPNAKYFRISLGSTNVEGLSIKALSVKDSVSVITNELSNKTFTKRVLTNGTLIENDEIAFYYLRNGNGADIAPWASLDIDDLGFTPTFCSDNNGFLNGSDHSYAPGGYQVSSNKVIFQAYGTTIPTNSVPLSRTLVLFK